MFSGHTESGGEHIRVGDQEFVEFYGHNQTLPHTQHTPTYNTSLPQALS